MEKEKKNGAEQRWNRMHFQDCIARWQPSIRLILMVQFFDENELKAFSHQIKRYDNDDDDDADEIEFVIYTFAIVVHIMHLFIFVCMFCINLQSNWMQWEK